jgi:pectate lyase
MKSWCLVGLLTAFAGSTASFAAPAWSQYAQQPDDWYRSSEGTRITTNILSWQSPHGSWPKNGNTATQPYTGDPQKIQGTFDNGATTDELRFLARVYRVTKDGRSKQAFLKGIDHILAAQYPSGGWPQFYPPSEQYHRHITFNDNSMVRVLEFLREIATSADYAFLDDARRRSAQTSFERGIACILKCQIPVNGKLTVWCAQHDEKDYRPVGGRTYELVSLSGAESADILRFLMSLEKPSPEIIRAVEAGAEWFESARLTGIRVARTNGNDRAVLKDPSAPPLWARFYEIETNRPMFSGRDGVKKYSMAEIERERRNGYAWYGNWGAEVARDFAKWKEKWLAGSGNVEPPSTSRQKVGETKL